MKSKEPWNRSWSFCFLLLLVAPGFLVDGVLAAQLDVHCTSSLSGSGWWIHEAAAGTGAAKEMSQASVPDEGWIPAEVPGNIQADLESAHTFRPICYGATDPALYDVARKDWWYRKDFSVPQSHAGKRITLVFDGVDERCEVWLNGTRIGANAGMFRRFQFDVSSVVRPGQTNHLAVWIARMPEELVPYLVNSDGPGEKDPFGPFGFMTGVNRTRQRLKDLKTPGNFSYDWAFNVWTLGIWKDVRLEATGPARIDWTRVETSLADNFNRVMIRPTLEVNSLSGASAEVVLTVTGPGTKVSQKAQATLKAGTNFIKAEIPLDRPSLWWPNGQGEQPLYTLSAEVKSADGVVSDARTTRFGIRDLRWVHTEGAPAGYVNRYQLVINGRKVRTIGSGLILPGVLPVRAAAHNLQLMHQAKACGFNVLRLNGGGGGGPIFNEAWYDLADELGIMIQWEAPIGNSTGGLPERDEPFLRNLEISFRSMIKESRNHPSIIEYGGGNEMEWDEKSTHPALQVMRKVAGEETDRLFRATSPDLGGKHAPWDFDISGSNTGWGGSYAHFNSFLQSTKDPNTETMSYSEFGSCSPSHLEVWHRDAPLASQWPLDTVDDPVLIRKNATRAVFSPEHWLVKKRIDRVFGSPDNLEDVIRGGQYLGADGLRYIYDELRRKGLRLANITNHCFSEPCPNLAGSYLVDYDGRTLMNYDFVRQAMAPISLSLRMDGVLFSATQGLKPELFLVSDAPRSAEGLCWKWLARDRVGKVFAQERGTADIRPLEVKSLGKIALNPSGKASPGLILLELRLEDANGRLLTERVQVFGDKDAAGPLAGLLRNGGSKSGAAVPVAVCRTTLAVKAPRQRVDGGQEILEWEVHNNGPMTALFCEPHPLLVYRTDLLIDNNNCFIPSGESRVITLHAARCSACGLSLAQTGWRISCWNADDLLIAPNDDVLLAVGRRDEMCREFGGYSAPDKSRADGATHCRGNRPDAGLVPYRLQGGGLVRFEFEVTPSQAVQPTRLRLHTADQARSAVTVVEVAINGRKMEASLPEGSGIQSRDPAHLAYPATLEFEIQASQLHVGRNSLTVGVKGDGWFTWDALDLLATRDAIESGVHAAALHTVPAWAQPCEMVMANVGNGKDFVLGCYQPPLIWLKLGRRWVSPHCSGSSVCLQLGWDPPCPPLSRGGEEERSP
jgi:beta-mannosidase